MQIYDEMENEKLRNEEDRALRDSDSKYFVRISTFSKPYFKTKSGMPAPMNEDAKYKIENQFLDMYQSYARPCM